MKLQEPTLNFISGHKNDNGKIEIALNQFGKGLDWLKPLKKLFPFDINRLTVYDGKIAYYDFTTDPKVRLHLQNIHLDALNLTNAKGNPEELPSRIYLQALSTGNGELNLTMKINVQKLVPDIDMDLSFKNINMRALLDFCKAYANVEVENGDFNLYAEMAVIKGKFSGYVKPIFNEMEFVDWNKSHHKSFQLMWETMLNALIESFENKRINQYAPSITLRGEIAQSDISFWPALWNVFTNGFVQSFDYKNDRAVSFASSNISGVSEFDESKSKAELKRKKRKEKRERKLKAKKDLKGKIRKRKS